VSKLVTILLSIILSPFVACIAQPAMKGKLLVDSLNDASFKIRQSEVARSFIAARQALSVSTELNYIRGVNTARLNLGVLHETRGQYDSALHYLRMVTPDEKQPLYDGLAEFHRGRTYMALRDFEKAKTHFARAGKIFDAHKQELLAKTEWNDFIGGVANSLGSIEYLQSNYNEALQYYLQALEIRTDAGVPINKMLHNIAIVYRRLNNEAKALEFQRRAVRISYEKKDTTSAIQIIVSMGNGFLGMKKFDSASLLYDSAYKLAIRINHANAAANALLNKADLKAKQKQYNEALTLLRRTIPIAQRYSNFGNLTHAYKQLSSTFYSLGKIDSAIFYEKKSLDLAVQTNYRSSALLSAATLSNYYKEIRSFDSAFKYNELHIKYREKTDSLNNQSKFSDLRVRIETLEQDQEIANLKAQQEIDQLQNQRLVLALVSFILLAGLVVAGLIARQRAQSRANEVKQLKLQAELDANRESLYKQTLGMIHVNNCLDQVQEQVKEMMSSQFDVRLGRVVNLIKTNKTLQNDWENFNNFFSNVHSSFYKKLAELNPNLTTHEKRVCALLKLGLSNREIATLLNIEPKSVVMIKYRIKKKLNLEENTDLETLIMKL
jgi:tetratricopeptide (TPR) repeat protein/DNA-binding CsgD family transcriptional regulator